MYNITCENQIRKVAGYLKGCGATSKKFKHFLSDKAAACDFELTTRVFEFTKQRSVTEIEHEYETTELSGSTQCVERAARTYLRLDDNDADNFPFKKFDTLVKTKCAKEHELIINYVKTAKAKRCKGPKPTPSDTEIETTTRLAKAKTTTGKCDTNQHNSLALLRLC